MDQLEKLVQKRKAIVKTVAVLLIIYGIGALIFFALNAFGVIDLYGLTEYEKGRTAELATMGTCALGVLTGILCLVKINDPGWYGILYVLSICTIILHAFISIGQSAIFDSIAAFAIVFVEMIFACICGVMLYKLKASQTKLDQ